MRALLLVLLAGCWQMTAYVGPRVTPDREIGVELGVSLGAAVPAGGGAVATSVDTSMLLASRQTSTTVARGGAIAEPAAPYIGSIRGVVEWTKRPAIASIEPISRADGLGWRAGVFAGVDTYEPAPQERSFTPIVGATATISPWVWGFEDHTNQQSITLGFQFAAESTGTLRAALACDMQFLPKL